MNMNTFPRAQRIFEVRKIDTRLPSPCFVFFTGSQTKMTKRIIGARPVQIVAVRQRPRVGPESTPGRPAGPRAAEARSKGAENGRDYFICPRRCPPPRGRAEVPPRDRQPVVAV